MTIKKNIDMFSSAVVVQVPVGVTPALDICPVAATQVQPFWTLAEALKFAVDNKDSGDGSVIWIKCGDQIMGPDEIKAFTADLSADQLSYMARHAHGA